MEKNDWKQWKCAGEERRKRWTERRTNNNILETTGEERELMKIIRERQLGFWGHVMRQDGLENLSITGRIPGKRREKYMDGVKQTLEGGISIGRVLQKTRNREERSITAGHDGRTVSIALSK